MDFTPEPFPEGGRYGLCEQSTLKNIEKHRDHFTVFSHLDHDTAGGHGGVNTFLTGVRKQESGVPGKKCSLDQIAAEHVGSAARFPSITLEIE